MLKVFNKDPHFMRDAVVVDSYADAGYNMLHAAEARPGNTYGW